MPFLDYEVWLVMNVRRRIRKRHGFVVCIVVVTLITLLFSSFKIFLFLCFIFNLVARVHRLRMASGIADDWLDILFYT